MAAQRPSIFACLTQSARSASLPPPAIRERSHGVLASRGVAVRGRAVFMVAEGERPHLLHQKDSALAEWYQKRTVDARGGTRKTMIVALARKLLIALWRLVTTGEAPAGLLLRPAA